ncbi:MAG: dihydrolipoamide acetyltransferase family protein [Gemmatimonadota bacterium]|uniref:dihydrolipoamide acetyltransferase family protein n=1 Tax=Candidatus Palauibacter scopulicola TaxID=3056741 RepID=UPI0023A12C39|nr:dihydrolipoamide acetyltransferase family protein [Candidatus Palauibacter scopulicola]MDE2662757.1 dihydrolipoamide acetyltransferase family protein [Candidatus Palauibacter scopulicola]
MSKVDVIMPQMGESIAEGTLTRWLKNVGDAVERDEDLFEISTDKVDADIPSPAAGVLAEVLVQDGETVEIDTVVARIETDATVAAPAAPSAPPADPPLDARAVEPVASTAVAAVPMGPAADATPASPSPAAGGAPASRDERLRTRSTPLVRKIAAEHGVDIHQVPGTGTSGRVTRDDILAFISAGGPEAAPAPTAVPAPSPAPTPVAAPAAVPSPVPASDVKAPEPALPETAAPGPAAPGTLRIPIHGATLDVRLGSVPIRDRDRVEEMSRVRLRTMEHMLMSKRVSAHVTSVIEVDFERVVQLRRSLKSRFADQGVKLTYGPFIYRAVIEALGEYPVLNSSVDGSRIVYHGNINLGIAVAINDGRELIVPVLKDADQLSLLGLAQRSNELAGKARGRALDFDDIQGGTFTITNVGVFGNLFGTPIINQPQVAILGTGVIEKRPVVVQDGFGNDVIAIRNRAYFGLSYDHRVVDGAMAAFFLNRVQEYLEGFPDDSA